MGGKIADELGPDVHYFVSEDVWSAEIAHEAGVEQVMQIQWITKLWEEHQRDEIVEQKALREIETSYRMPIFYNLTFAVTGFTSNVINLLQDRIERNKGVFSKNFNKRVDILIVSSGGVDNEKHRTATSLGKLTLSEKWLYDSVENGYAMNVKREDREFYILKSTGPLNSTVNQSNIKADFGCDLSRLSVANVDESVRPSRSIRHSVRESSTHANINPTRSEFAIPRSKSTKTGDTTRKTMTSIKVPEKPKAISKFMNGKNVHVATKDDAIIGKLTESGATLVSELDSEKEVDFLVIPGLSKPKLPFNFKRIGEFVNHIWINDCITADRLVEIEFHHRLLDFFDNEKKPLRNEIFVSSGYSLAKKSFVKTLVERLGAKFSDSLKKSDQPILICPVPEGIKYESAILWDFTVLSVEWLIECFQCQMRINEKPYLIGKSKVSRNNVEQNCRRSSFVPSSQELPEFNNYTDPVYNSEDHDNNVGAENRNAISLDNKTKSNVEKVRELLTNMPTPERKRMLRDVTNAPSSSPPAIVVLRNVDNANIVDSDNEEPGIKFFEDESPELTKLRWRRIKAMDKYYRETPPRSGPKPNPDDDLEVEEPYEVRRFLFLKRAIPDYSSPDPRSKNAALRQNSAEQENSIDPSNFLAFQSESVTMHDNEN